MILHIEYSKEFKEVGSGKKLFSGGPGSLSFSVLVVGKIKDFKSKARNTRVKYVEILQAWDKLAFRCRRYLLHLWLWRRWILVPVLTVKGDGLGGGEVWTGIGQR